MDVYRMLCDCCVCGSPITIMQPRYEGTGLTAHRACAEYVEDAAHSRKYDRLSIVAFRERMREETRGIEKGGA